MIDLAPMTSADYDEVLALWRTSEGIGLSPAADSREGIASYLERNPGLSWVVREGGGVVGAALCGHDGRRGFIHHVAVAREHRGRGTGRALVTRCLEGLRAIGMERCHLFVRSGNPDGLEFWRHMGWRLRDDVSMMTFTMAAPHPSRDG